MRRIKLGAALAAITAVAAVSTPGIASAETSQTRRPSDARAHHDDGLRHPRGCRQWALGERWPPRNRRGSHVHHWGTPSSVGQMQQAAERN